MPDIRSYLSSESDSPYLPRLPELITVIRREWLVQKRQIRVRWRLSLHIIFIVASFVWLLGLVPWFRSSLQYYLLLALALAQVLPAISESIARERETGSLDMLLLTPLRSSEILGGKLIAACLPVLSIILMTTFATALILIVFSVREAVPITYGLRPLYRPLTLLFETMFCCFLALYCSTLFHASMRALATTVSILAGAFLLPMVFSNIIAYSRFYWLYSLIRPIVCISLLLPSVLTAAGTTALCGKIQNRLRGKCCGRRPRSGGNCVSHFERLNCRSPFAGDSLLLPSLNIRCNGLICRTEA